MSGKAPKPAGDSKMTVNELVPNVHHVGARHWDRRLFDELIPLPQGTSYNAYLIQGNRKVALIDTVDPELTHELFDNLEKLDVTKIDYLITNHAEQDHSGSLPAMLEKFPEARVVTNAKCMSFLIDHLHLPEEVFLVIKDGETLSLGNLTLEFIIAPWVHWPETMFTYLKEDKILFPCDFLGSHLATSDLFAVDESTVYEAAKRYYAEIMMPFRPQIKKHLKRLEKFDIGMIAPSHGPVYHRPEFILEAYRDWVSDEVSNEVVLPYVSMHGSTGVMVNHLVEALMDRGITVRPFNLTRSDLGEMAKALVDAATIVLASPTVLIGPHPAAAYAAVLVNALRPKAKHAAIIGSYGWGSKMVDQVTGMLGNLKVELLEPILIKGLPKEADLAALDELADAIVIRHQSLGLIE